MNKGIFWCHIVWCDDDIYGHNLDTVMVKCDIDGNPLEEAEFTSKSGDNFNHKVEWAKRGSNKKPYNYYPRGRVEIKNGKIRIYANPVIIADEEAKALIVKSFELKEQENIIKWIPDNSKHYLYIFDAMGW